MFSWFLLPYMAVLTCSAAQYQEENPYFFVFISVITFFDLGRLEK